MDSEGELQESSMDSARGEASMDSDGELQESSDELDMETDEAMNTVYDSDFCGSDADVSPARCKHDAVASRMVAFEGENTGMRFLGCGIKGDSKCDYVKWVDPVWPPTLLKALYKLWETNHEATQECVSNQLDLLEMKFRFQHQIEKMEADIKSLKDQLAERNKLTDDIGASNGNNVSEYGTNTSNHASFESSQKLIIVDAEKEKVKLEAENKVLKLKISELLEEQAVDRMKISEIRNICGQQTDWRRKARGLAHQLSSQPITCECSPSLFDHSLKNG